MKHYFLFDDTYSEINLVRHEHTIVSSATGCRHYLEKFNASITTVDDFKPDENSKAYYFVNLVGAPKDFLSGYKDKNIFFNLPEKILALIQSGKVKLILDNRLEGAEFYTDKNSIKLGYYNDPLFVKEVDWYQVCHFFMDMFEIPDIIFISGDQNFNRLYTTYCNERNLTPRIEHHSVIFWNIIFRDRIPNYPLILDAVKNSDAANFNSLNRTSRPHKNDHIRFLHRENLLNKGLISHHYTTDNIRPMQIDGDFSSRNPDEFEENVFNHNIYRNSLLTFTTETGFYNYSLFLTEKTFKPILAGHPFLSLSQPGTLAKLKELGYRTDFTYFTDYDNVTDHYERFRIVHDNLKMWIYMPKDQKINWINENLPIIQHNQDLARDNFFYHQQFFADFLRDKVND